MGVQFISGLLFFFYFTACDYTPCRGAIPKYTLHVFCTPRCLHRVRYVQRGDPRFVNYNCLLLSLHKTKSGESHEKQLRTQPKDSTIHFAYITVPLAFRSARRRFIASIFSFFFICTAALGYLSYRGIFTFSRNLAKYDT